MRILLALFIVVSLLVIYQTDCKRTKGQGMTPRITQQSHTCSTSTFALPPQRRRSPETAGAPLVVATASITGPPPGSSRLAIRQPFHPRHDCALTSPTTPLVLPDLTLAVSAFGDVASSFWSNPYPRSLSVGRKRSHSATDLASTTAQGARSSCCSTLDTVLCTGMFGEFTTDTLFDGGEAFMMMQYSEPPKLRCV